MAKDQPLNDQELAAALRVDVVRVARLAAEGMPRRSDGRWDLAAVADWIEARGLGRRCNWRGVVRTLGQVAAAFGVARDTVRKDWRAAGMPGRSPNWDLAEIAIWRRARDDNRAPVAQGSTEELLRKRAAEARLREGQARRIERENRIAEETVCYRADVERFLSQLFEFIRELHGRVAVEIGPQLPKEHAEEIAEDLEARLVAIQRTLHGWARRLEEIEHR